MKIAFIIIGIIILSIVIFVIYRYFAFKRESELTNKLRFERIEPLFQKLENGEQLSIEEVSKYAKDNKTRKTTYQLLAEHNKTDLFPSEYLTIESAAESSLVNWLEFPTELDGVPDEIEQVERVIIKFDGNDVYYHVFKFKINEPHWAAKDGWMLAVVRPYFDDSKPYDFPAATFSRLSSKHGEIDPKDEAKWVHENIAMKR